MAKPNDVPARIASDDELSPAQLAMIQDGAPRELMRAPETPKEADARRKRFARTHGPDRKLKDPKWRAQPTGLGMSPFETHTAGAALKGAENRSDTMKTKSKSKPSKSRKGSGGPKSKRPAKAARTSARTPVAAAKGAGGVRPGSKLAIIVDLLNRPQGCTTADVLKATDWPSVSMPQQAKAAGITLAKEKIGNVTTYRNAANVTAAPEPKATKPKSKKKAEAEAKPSLAEMVQAADDAAPVNMPAPGTETE